MARRMLLRISWPPRPGLDLPLALAAALIVLGLVVFLNWLPGRAAADGPWQTPT